MSRNIGKTSCIRCGHSRMKLEEKARHITKVDAGRWIEMFRRMLVAKAHCPVCQTKYLAWVDGRERFSGYPSFNRELGYADLSYRSTFDDEPGASDILFIPDASEVRNVITKVDATTILVQTLKVVRLTPVVQGS